MRRIWRLDVFGAKIQFCKEVRSYLRWGQSRPRILQRRAFGQRFVTFCPRGAAAVLLSAHARAAAPYRYCVCVRVRGRAAKRKRVRGICVRFRNERAFPSVGKLKI